MTEQVQNQPTEEQAISVGFGKALMILEPDWRNKFSPDQINQFRHFYSQGTQDAVIVLNVAEQQKMQTLNANMGAIQQTIMRTGNEAAIEAAEREAAARAQAEADAAAEIAGEAETPAKGKAKTPVKKAVKQPGKPAAKTPKKR